MTLCALGRPDLQGGKLRLARQRRGVSAAQRDPVNCEIDACDAGAVCVGYGNGNLNRRTLGNGAVGVRGQEKHRRARSSREYSVAGKTDVAGERSDEQNTDQGQTGAPFPAGGQGAEGDEPHG